MAVAPLPPELWNLICSYLPNDEVLRLLSLNSTFLSSALSIRYGTFSIRPSSDLKALLRPLGSPYVLGKVHTLGLSSNADRISCLATTMLPSFALVQLQKWKRQHIVDSIRHLRGISCLIIGYYNTTGINLQNSYMDFAWQHISHSMVVLDLRLQAAGLHHFASLDPSVVCTHVRTLKLSVSIYPRKVATIPLPQQTLFDNAMQRLSALVAPSSLVELILTQSRVHVTCYPVFRSFTGLKKLVFSHSGSFPFEIGPLLRNNLQTLEELQLYQAPDTWGRPLDWSQILLLGQNLRKFVLQIEILHDHDHAIILSQLAHCHRLDHLELVGVWGTDFSSEAYHQIFKKILETLSRNCPDLTQLTLPFNRLNPPFILHIVATLPNLTRLMIRGAMPILCKDILTAMFLDRFRNMDRTSRWAELIFENLRTMFPDGKLQSDFSFSDNSDLLNCLFECGTLSVRPRFPN